MEKPEIKQVSLEIAEDVAMSVVKKVVRPYAEYYIAKSNTKIDDILLPFLDQLEEAVMKQLDGIDGKEG